MGTMAFQSTTMFLPDSRWFVGSLEFLTDKFGNLSLQQPESSEVVGSGIGNLPLASARVSLVNEARLRLGSLQETDTDPMEDRVDHTQAAQVAATDLIYSPSSRLNSEYGREVYMVGEGGELPERTTDRDRLRHRSRSIHEEFGQVEYQGEQVYRTPVHNGLDSRMLVDQITPISPRITKRSTRKSSGSW
jgi:hypothetical protein